MPVSESPAHTLALSLWQQAAGGATDPAVLARAAAGLAAALRRGLDRWIGADGYRALLGRALDESRELLPVLTAVSAREPDELALQAAVRQHGADALAEGMVALLTTLIELLARIMGEDIALRLVEEAGLSVLSPTGPTHGNEEPHG